MHRPLDTACLAQLAAGSDGELTRGWAGAKGRWGGPGTFCETRKEALDAHAEPGSILATRIACVKSSSSIPSRKN